MKSKQWIVILFVGLLTLAACGPLRAAGSEGGVEEGCPTVTGDMQLLVNDEHGYCLLYPAGFEASQPVEYETMIVGPVPGAGDRARAFVEVHESAGRTAEQVADEAVAEITGNLPGFEIERGSVTIGGEEAVVLDNVPGQDIGRQVVAVRGDRVYKLTFVPADETQAEAYQQMEALYAAVIDSFTFLPGK